jgi:ABC-type transport system involved in multi-copper enzyme maturation permease subunit
MLGEVFRFELWYRLRQPSVLAWAAVLFGMPFLMMHAINGSSLPLNAPEMVANACTIFSALGMVVTAALFGDAAMRDVETRMYALFYTVPLRERDYLAGRFLAALVVNAVLLLGIPLGLLAASVMPYMSAGKFGPVVPAAYVQPYLLVLLPNLVLTAVVLFAVAALTRRTLTTYLGAVVVLVVRTVAAQLTAGSSHRVAAALADPLGGAAIDQTTRYWTLIERATHTIGFPTLLLWNRAIWLGVSAVLCALLALKFRFAQPASRRTRRGARAVTDLDAEPRIAPIAAPVAPPRSARVFGVRVRAWQTLAAARRALREIAGNRIFLLIAAASIPFVFAVGWDVGAQVFDTSTWPVTHLVAATVLGTVLGPVMVTLIAIFAGELVWRERDVRLGEIADVAPVPDGVALLGRFLALVAMIVVLQCGLMASGVLLQAVRGYHAFELDVYLRILFGVKLVDYVLFAALAMTVHVLVNQKYLGHLVVVLCYAFTLFAGQLGIRHHLLIYGTDPGWIYSDMNGFGPFVRGLVWFKLYWAAWALLLGVLASLFWVRGRTPGPRARIALARSRLTRPVLRAAGVAVGLICALGGFVFYNTNVVNEYRTPHTTAERRATYERRYKRFEHAPQPTIVGANVRAEIYRERQAVEVGGTYRLVNRTPQPIDSVHVILSADVATRSVGFDRAAVPVLDDESLRYRIYALAQPLQPGDTLRLSFDVRFHPEGFRNGDTPTAVTRNGAFFDRGWLPTIGYQAAAELGDEDERRELGLPPHPPMPSWTDTAARQWRFDRPDVDLVDVETIVGTDEGPTVVALGTLQKEWRERGRHYFQFRTESPLTFASPVFAAEYATRDARWTPADSGPPVALRVLYHATHGVNVDRMLRAMQASLGYYSAHFGPYQFRELRVVEFPRYAEFARAHPYTIAYSEGSAFLTRVDSGDVDRPYFVTAHETAHQWWGGQIMGARVRGRALLSETLAQYSAMMVMEHALGREQARKFYDFEMDNYLTNRRVYTNREVPLLDVTDQRYLYYHKGAVAMYTLRERIGADAVNTALQRYLRKYRDAGPPYPTSRDLYAELQAVTPDSVKPLLRDLFETITLWNVRAESARAEPVGGAYRVTLDVVAAKVHADSVGAETPVPMDDLVEIGVFADADGAAPGEPLYLQPHRIHAGRQTIVVTVPLAPARAGIDPYHRLIDREPGDNVIGVDGASRMPRP